MTVSFTQLNHGSSQRVITRLSSSRMWMSKSQQWSLNIYATVRVQISKLISFHLQYTLGTSAMSSRNLVTLSSSSYKVTGESVPHQWSNVRILVVQRLAHHTQTLTLGSGDAYDRCASTPHLQRPPLESPSKPYCRLNDTCQGEKKHNEYNNTTISKSRIQSKSQQTFFLPFVVDKTTSVGSVVTETQGSAVV